MTDVVGVLTAAGLLAWQALASPTCARVYFTGFEAGGITYQEDVYPDPETGRGWLRATGGWTSTMEAIVLHVPGVETRPLSGGMTLILDGGIVTPRAGLRTCPVRLRIPLVTR